MTVDVIPEDTRWTAVGLEALAKRAVTATLDHLDLGGGDWDVSVLGCDDTRIAILNAEFRDRPAATNVLSWPSEQRTPCEAPTGDPELGDIAIAFETCAREAETGGIPLENHVLHLVVHGTLHLLGYDHESGSEADLMEATEIAILAGLGVPNPYER